MDLSVVICTYNRAKSLLDTLEALLVQETPPSLTWEIIVVDNNSRDNTCEVVETLARRSALPVGYVFEPSQGQSYARNTGVKIARGEIIAFTDDDVIPEKTWITKLVAAVSYHQADGVGGRILPKWEAPAPGWLRENRHIWWCIALLHSEKVEILVWPEVKGSPQIWGANMAFKRSVFYEVGCFDTRLGNVGRKLYRGEETELIRRALKKGKKLIYDPKLMVHHRIDANRMTKNFFRKVAFDSGQAQVELSALEFSVAVFGAPRWLYGILARGACRWVTQTLLGREDAFGTQVDFFDYLGRLWGFWKLRFARRGC